MAGNPKLLDQAEGRKELRLVEDEFSENLVVENVQGPRAKPDGVNDENRSDEEQDQNDPEEPSQQANKHNAVGSLSGMESNCEAARAEA
jgi:hypothetical protein